MMVRTVHNVQRSNQRTIAELVANDAHCWALRGSALPSAGSAHVRGWGVPRVWKARSWRGRGENSLVDAGAGNPHTHLTSNRFEARPEKLRAENSRGFL